MIRTIPFNSETSLRIRSRENIELPSHERKPFFDQNSDKLTARLQQLHFPVFHIAIDLCCNRFDSESSPAIWTWIRPGSLSRVWRIPRELQTLYWSRRVERHTSSHQYCKHLTSCIPEVATHCGRKENLEEKAIHGQSESCWSLKGGGNWFLSFSKKKRTLFSAFWLWLPGYFRISVSFLICAWSHTHIDHQTFSKDQWWTETALEGWQRPSGNANIKSYYWAS